MEFVDNALDDAEALYDPETGAYQRPVIIDVFVSRSSRTLRILTPTNFVCPNFRSADGQSFGNVSPSKLAPMSFRDGSPEGKSG